MSSFLSFWFTVNILTPVSASSNICCWTRLAPRVMCENRKKKEKNVQPGRSIWLQLEGSTSETWAPFSLHLKKKNILLWTFYECVFYPYCTSKRCKNASNDLDFQWWYRSPSECTWSGKQFKQNPSQTTSFRWNHPVSGLKFICETTLGVIFLYHYSPSISISPVGELYTPLTMEFCICNDEGYISECVSAAVVEPKWW